jgi:hypothetical protein
MLFMFIPIGLLMYQRSNKMIENKAHFYCNLLLSFYNLFCQFLIPNISVLSIIWFLKTG